MNNLNRLGLAVMQPALECHADWLMHGARDIELQDLCESVELMEGGWITLARHQAALLQKHTGRIGVHAPFWNMHLDAIDPQVRQVVQGRYQMGLDFTQEVGGQWLVVHSPFYFWGHPMVQHRRTLAQEIGLAQLTLEPVLARAADLGITVVIENILDRDPAPLMALVSSFASPHVRLSVDTGHAHVGAQQGGLSAQGWLTQTAPLLGHVHIQDNDGSADEHLAPGEGTLHWAGVLRALQATTTDPYLIVEVMPDQVDAAVRWIDRVATTATPPTPERALQKQGA